MIQGPPSDHSRCQHYSSAPSLPLPPHHISPVPGSTFPVARNQDHWKPSKKLGGYFVFHSPHVHMAPRLLWVMECGLYRGAGRNFTASEGVFQGSGTKQLCTACRPAFLIWACLGEDAETFHRGFRIFSSGSLYLEQCFSFKKLLVTRPLFSRKTAGHHSHLISGRWNFYAWKREQ